MPTKEVLPSTSWGYGYATSETTPDRITGNVFQRVEALGLPEKQEEAIKGLIRQAIWDCFREAVYLKPETFSELMDRKFAANATSQSNGTPQGSAV